MDSNRSSLHEERRNRQFPKGRSRYRQVENIVLSQPCLWIASFLAAFFVKGFVVLFGYSKTMSPCLSRIIYIYPLDKTI